MTNRMLGALAVLAVGLLAVAADALVPGPEDGSAVFAVGSIDGLSPGDSFFYRMAVDADWALPYAGRGVGGMLTEYARVVVTDVLKAGDGVRVKVRVDSTDEEGKVAEHGRDLYEILLARKGDKVNVVVNANYRGLEPASLSFFNVIPCMLLGYPEVAEVPKDEAAPAIVQARKLGAFAVRQAPSYDAKDGLVKAKVEYFRQAREGDREKGKQKLYLAPNPDRLLSSPPMGTEAGPLLTAKNEYPRDKYGPPQKYSVWPVTPQQTEEQEWEPGAAFPRRVVRHDERGMLLFDLTFVRTEKVSLDEPPAEPWPAPPG